MQIVGFGLNQEGPGAGLYEDSGALPYRQALLTLIPTYAWLAADLAAGAVAAWPCAVTGVQATQATAEARPTASAAALNGKSGLTFDGGDSLLTPDFASAIAQPFVIVSAHARTGAIGATAQFIYSGTVLASGRPFLYHAATTNEIQAAAASALLTGITINGPFVSRFVCNGASSSITVNGATTSGNAGIHNLPALGIGYYAVAGDRWLIGTIGDILVFSGTDYAARAASADALMRTYYGI
jgi:hypothetical protein